MMRDEDKPFICYQQGWNIKIFPRNGEGWRALGLWMLALLFPVTAFMPVAIHFDDTPYEFIVAWGALPVVLAIVIIGIAMIRWMKARSQIVDLNAVAKFQQEQERQAKKRGR